MFWSFTKLFPKDDYEYHLMNLIHQLMHLYIQ